MHIFLLCVYVIVIAQLTGIYGSKLPSPRAQPEDKAVYVAISPIWQLCYKCYKRLISNYSAEL